MRKAGPQIRESRLAPHGRTAMILAMRTGVALGSDLGDRLSSLRAARDLLVSLHEGGDPPAASPVYETDPVDCPPDTPDFLNAVVEIETSLDPARLLAMLSELERRLGRPGTRGKNAPRCLDADILYAGDLRRESGQVIIPHPRMTRRRFVMQPLCDIRPGLVLPGWREAASRLLERLPEVPAVRIFARQW